MRDLSAGEARVYLELELRRVLCRHCEKVKQEKLPWLSDNPFYTKRFAFFVGRRCRKETIRDVARELHLDWKTVKDLEQQYMREQLRRVSPMQWAAIFHKRHVRMTRGIEHLRFYSDTLDRAERVAPCKVSCARCGTPIADEGRRMYGLLRGSFVPPPPIRELRDLTRYRSSAGRHNDPLEDIARVLAPRVACP